jgi:hypothetical protein
MHTPRPPPGLLLQDVSVLESNARQVHSLLEGARDRDALLTALPLLLEPRTLISVLITVVRACAASAPTMLCRPVTSWLMLLCRDNLELRANKRVSPPA